MGDSNGINTFNKFLVILIALVSISFWVTVVLLIWLVPDAMGVSLRSFSTLIRAHNVLFQALVTTFGVSSILVSLLILAGEFANHEPSAFKLKTPSGGIAFLSVDSLSQRLRASIESLSGVNNARVRLRSARDKMDVFVDAGVSQDTNLSAKSEEIVSTVKSIASEQLGVQVRNAQVGIRYDSRTRPSNNSTGMVTNAATAESQEILVRTAHPEPEGPATMPLEPEESERVSEDPSVPPVERPREEQPPRPPV